MEEKSEHENHGGDSWGVEQEPTTLIVFWPGEQPTQLEVLAALGAACGRELEIMQELQRDDDRVIWNAVVRPLEERIQWIVWCEPSRPVPQGELSNDPAEKCQWVIGVETMLDPTDALEHFAAILRALFNAMPQSPGVLDANTTHWHARKDLDEMFGERSAGPPSEILWTIHVIGPDVEDDKVTGDSTMWMHTHGLWRCGLPELEMLEVPAKHAEGAWQLLNGLAEIMLDAGAPPCDVAFEIGPGLGISLRHWEEMARNVGADSAGGMDDRDSQAEAAHTGARAVICGPEPEGANGSVWGWPNEAIHRLENDESTIYRSHRATERQANMARATWDELATAFAAVRARSKDGRAPKPAAAFLLKAAYISSTGERGLHGEEAGLSREHLWFEIQGFDKDSARGKLINEPIGVAQLKQGDVVQLRRADVTDWMVMGANGRCDPTAVARLWDIAGLQDAARQ